MKTYSSHEMIDHSSNQLNIFDISDEVNINGNFNISNSILKKNIFQKMSGENQYYGKSETI